MYAAIQSRDREIMKVKIVEPDALMAQGYVDGELVTVYRESDTKEIDIDEMYDFYSTQVYLSEYAADPKNGESAKVFLVKYPSFSEYLQEQLK